MMTCTNETDPLEGVEARPTRGTRMWLNAGAVTLGVGAAMVAGAAVASADTGSSNGASTSATSSSSSSAPAKAKSARKAEPKPVSSTRRTAPAKPSAESGTITTPSTTVRAEAARRTPSATALAVASTTAAASDQPGVLSVPTPNKILQSLEEFGHNVYLTVANQISGTQANLTVLRDDLANVFGISRVTITTPGIYGTPTQNKQYYVGMQDFYSAAIATVASAYGQLTRTAPDLAGFTAAALTTESLTYPGYKIYRGADANSFVLWTDSYELLQDKNVSIISRIYYGEQKTRAINDLAAGLQDPTKVMIVAVTGAVDGRTTPGEKIVTVIGLDTTRNVVTINDPTQANGQGLEMNFDDFVDQWGSQNYRLVTAQLAASSSTPLPAPATKLTWALPAPNEIGQALQNAGKAVALLVVHQIEGAQANLGDLANDLGYTFGINDPDIGPPAPASIEYGDYTKNYPYFVYQGNYPTCLLMATAAVIGQLRGGAMPADLGQQIYNLATSTPSGVYPGQKIYEPTGTGQNGLHWGTNSADAVKLMNMNGINADWTTFLKSQGDVAMDTMTSALSQNQGVIVALSSNVIWNAYTRKYFNETRRQPGPTGPRSDHAVVVISVDMTKKVVYINDSALPNGQGFPIPLDEFMKAWQYSEYSLITAEPAAT